MPEEPTAGGDARRYDVQAERSPDRQVQETTAGGDARRYVPIAPVPGAERFASAPLRWGARHRRLLPTMPPSPEPRPALPQIIQGGMGIGVSHWRLARAVALLGQLGVVSGTALGTVLARRLQNGDADGSMRRALAAFPVREIASRILDRYFVAGGKAKAQSFRYASVYSQHQPQDLVDLTVAANFAEVFLAKEGHGGTVGINLLEKLQLPTLASLFGAMLAGVNVVLMGAGVPRAIPGVLDQLATGQKVELRLAVENATAGMEHSVAFDPAPYLRDGVALRRPEFLAIVSSSVLATTLARKASGHVDGFVIEQAAAGGHNAPPRGVLQLDERGQPVYGPRDVPDIAAIAALERPFWLAGSYASPGRLRAARALGANGIQIGTAFAFCAESALREDIKLAVIRANAAGTMQVRTDPRASPTGMPFKVVGLDATLSNDAVYQARTRVCDLGYIRRPYEREDGSLGYRCPAEPIADFLRKGGELADTVGRKCLCNGLLAAIGLGQALGGEDNEPAIVTAGEDVSDVARFLQPGDTSYTAAAVLRHVLAEA